ncbi:mechanosensitive ion channel family protein [Kordiimonas pumila]|uniref:Mechanosensitive ion channel family protein n=1 Tax=Kordiimonas pumila TaxID=2161677 RepID=A0ABV7D6C5_9PROT|nr:mechanosensitive ion channel domain-containing protein [Kordiimonas pumila]
MARGFNHFMLRLISPKGLVSHLVLFLLLAALFWIAEAGYLDPAREVLESPKLTVKMEGFTISPYVVLRSLFVILMFFWLSAFITSSFDAYLARITSLKISNRMLATKIFQIVIYSLLTLTALNTLGVNLTAFAFLSGAIGIGLGFGLQKIASNFISGLILLFEKSVEVGDLIELDDNTAGFIRRTGGRYTLLETFDSREIMIPNEDFITSRVVNWTFSNPSGRVDIAIGVAYGSNYELARDLILASAIEHSLCSKAHEPLCFLEDFAASSVNFTLYFWVDDVTQGRKQVRSDVLFTIARKFDEHGIVIPFPQQDVYVKSLPQEYDVSLPSATKTQKGKEPKS